MRRQRVPKEDEHVHVYSDKGFRCRECGYELDKVLEEKIRGFPGTLLNKDPEKTNEQANTTES